MALTIAIPKGRLGSRTIEILKAAGVGSTIDEDSRKLVFKSDNRNIEFILLKNSDVITYVENGIADIGISGKDMIMESSGDFYELYKMNIGKCKIAVAGIKGRKISGTRDNDFIVDFLTLSEDCDIIVITKSGIIKYKKK